MTIPIASRTATPVGRAETREAPTDVAAVRAGTVPARRIPSRAEMAAPEATARSTDGAATADAVAMVVGPNLPATAGTEATAAASEGRAAKAVRAETQTLKGGTAEEEVGMEVAAASPHSVNPADAAATVGRVAWAAAMAVRVGAAALAPDLAVMGARVAPAMRATTPAQAATEEVEAMGAVPAATVAKAAMRRKAPIAAAE